LARQKAPSRLRNWSIPFISPSPQRNAAASSPKEMKMTLLSAENGFANVIETPWFLAEINLYE
jgi:hypothetical protein